MLLLVGAAVILPAVAAAQQRTPTPSASELWQEYPLRQQPEATADRGARPTPASATPARVSSRRVSARTGAHGYDVTPFVVVIVLVIAAAATVLVNRRRRRSSQAPSAPRSRPPATLALPLLTVAAASGSRQEDRRQSPRLTTLAGEGPGDPAPRDGTVDGAGPPDPVERWTAEIVWQDGDGGPRFHVTASPAAGGPAERIASSAPLEWPPSDAVAVQRLRRSVTRIESAMRGAGWTPLPPGGAWYSKRFAWTPPAPAPAPAAAPRRFTPEDAWPAGTEASWRCEIRWRPGYVNSRFTVVARRPGHRRTANVASSQTFKWLILAEPDPEGPDFRRAVEHLDGEIREAGWEPAGSGRRWWQRRYVWGGEGDPPLELGAVPASVGQGGDDHEA